MLLCVLCAFLWFQISPADQLIRVNQCSSVVPYYSFLAFVNIRAIRGSISSSTLIHHSSFTTHNSPASRFDWNTVRLEPLGVAHFFEFTRSKR